MGLLTALIEEMAKSILAQYLCALKRLKIYMLLVLDIDPVVRTHVFSAMLYAKSIVMAI